MELCDKGLRWNMYESLLVYSSHEGVYLCNKPPQGKRIWENTNSKSKPPVYKSFAYFKINHSHGPDVNASL